MSRQRVVLLVAEDLERQRDAQRAARRGRYGSAERLADYGIVGGAGGMPMMSSSSSSSAPMPRMRMMKAASASVPNHYHHHHEHQQAPPPPSPPSLTPYTSRQLIPPTFTCGSLRPRVRGARAAP